MTYTNDTEFHEGLIKEVLEQYPEKSGKKRARHLGTVKPGRGICPGKPSYVGRLFARPEFQRLFATRTDHQRPTASGLNGLEEVRQHFL